MQIRDRIIQILTGITAIIGVILGAIKALPTPPVIMVPPPTVPTPTIPHTEKPASNPVCAIGKIQFGTAGCSATVIGPRRDDGRWYILTAAHCLRGQPEIGKMLMRSGRQFPIRVLKMDERSDCAWCETVHSEIDLPWLKVAESDPRPGEMVFHAGFGYDQPGNVEYGEVLTSNDNNGQTRYSLSVSSGDSGGGIALNSNNQILSPVCCTAGMARKSSVWGASPTSVNRLKGQVYEQEIGWTPIEIPFRKEPE